MLLKEILALKGSKVWSTSTKASLQDALTLLIKNKIGALLVLDDTENVVGVLSERDIMRECLANPKTFSKTPVSKVMTARVIIATPDDKVAHIMGVMTHNRVRHIPVLDQGKLVGLISIGDVVKAQLQETEYEIRYLKEYMFGG